LRLRAWGFDTLSPSPWAKARPSGSPSPNPLVANPPVANPKSRKGNIYTTKTYDGRRLQRFLYKGMQSVTKGEDQGTVWPTRTATR